jgi:hypothetical protein
MSLLGTEEAPQVGSLVMLPLIRSCPCSQGNIIKVKCKKISGLAFITSSGKVFQRSSAQVKQYPFERIISMNGFSFKE